MIIKNKKFSMWNTGIVTNDTYKTAVNAPEVPDPYSKQDAVNRKQEEELANIRAKRAADAKNRQEGYDRDTTDRVLNRKLGISFWKRNDADSVARRDARRAELQEVYNKNEEKIARQEKWQDRKLAAKHKIQDWDAAYEDKTGRDLGKDAAIAGGVAAAGAVGYAAYKAWKKKQANKKAAAAEAEAKFKKED